MVDKSPLDWIGKKQTSHDTPNLSLIKQTAVTLNSPCPKLGEALPPLWHWTLFQEALMSQELGKDGHPARGGFLPPAEGRNRMWAGGRLQFLHPLYIGQNAERCSTIADVQVKQGRTGELLFVTLRHEYFQKGELCIYEEQDIVYREPSPPKLSLDTPLSQPQWTENIHPTTVMLFRYSAVTFNGHRIHYDWPYATKEEGYPGLVVHGPMIATRMLQSFCKAKPGVIPVRYAYRGLRPLIANDDFQVAGRCLESGKAELWAANAHGLAHQAEVEYEEKS